LAVRTALEEVGHVEGLLPPVERAAVRSALEGVDAAMREASSAGLKAAREHLEQVSEPFARRRMERALLAGMEGKSLGQIEASLAEEEALEERRGSHTPQQT
jgi:molecular chaperone HscA